MRGMCKTMMEIQPAFLREIRATLQRDANIPRKEDVSLFHVNVVYTHTNTCDSVIMSLLFGTHATACKHAVLLKDNAVSWFPVFSMLQCLRRSFAM